MANCSLHLHHLAPSLKSLTRSLTRALTRPWREVELEAHDGQVLALRRLCTEERLWPADFGPVLAS